jgi:hypothetical protein
MAHPSDDYDIRKDALNAATVALSGLGDRVSASVILRYAEQFRKYLEYGTTR